MELKKKKEEMRDIRDVSYVDSISYVDYFTDVVRVQVDNRGSNLHIQGICIEVHAQYR